MYYRGIEPTEQEVCAAEPRGGFESHPHRHLQLGDVLPWDRTHRARGLRGGAARGVRIPPSPPSPAWRCIAVGSNPQTKRSARRSRAGGSNPTLTAISSLAMHCRGIEPTN